MSTFINLYWDIDWSKGNYDRQIIEGLMLHTFRYSKHIIWSQMNNSDLSKSIFNSLTSWIPEYFDPIDLEKRVQVYIDIYSNLPKQFPEYKEEDEEEDKQEDKQRRKRRRRWPRRDTKKRNTKKIPRRGIPRRGQRRRGRGRQRMKNVLTKEYSKLGIEDHSAKINMNTKNHCLNPLLFKSLSEPGLTTKSIY